nr:uncharacterized protein LOC128687637 isoform X1 [Cherax quadricarinatus]XP_053631167.1 uncharacterized protein LOC128687637 isoform X1 [Cherax quadricarinatus]
MPLLRALTINWPFESMTLRDLVPPLPSPTTKPQRIILRSSEEKLMKFLEALQTIPETFIQSKSAMAVEFKGPLCKLDITGFSLPISNVHLLERFVRMAYNPNSPPHYIRNEIRMDIRIEGEAESQFQALHVVCTISRHHGAGLVVKFRKVNITSIPGICLVSLPKETECLELELCGLCNNSLLPLLCIPKSLTSLSLAHNRNITSLQFLSQLPCLCELNISGINVRDKCEPIGSLPQGLQYLKLVGCRVRSADLQVLITSKHVLTLRHLDLSENPLGGPEDFYSLCKLCQKLQKVSVLEVENCNLNTVIPELLTQLINILTQMPTLAFLRLNRNDFSSWSITKHIVCLGYSRTMRCLCMTVPSEVYISDDYTVIDKRIKKLCTDFLSSLQAMNATHVAVEWIEESLYSRWFYTI